jgi:hypothetical protein
MGREKKRVDREAFSKAQKIIFCFLLFIILASVLVLSTTTLSDTQIYTNGNVGIGTTSPNSTLSVIGNASVTGNISANYFVGNGQFLTGLSGINNLTASQIANLSIGQLNWTYSLLANNSILAYQLNSNSSYLTTWNSTYENQLASIILNITSLNKTANIGNLYNATASMISNLSINQLNWTYSLIANQSVMIINTTYVHQLLYNATASMIANTSFMQNFTVAAVQSLINGTSMGFAVVNATALNVSGLTSSTNITLTSGSIIKIGLTTTFPDCTTATNHSLAVNGTGLYYCSSNQSWSVIMSG